MKLDLSRRIHVPCAESSYLDDVTIGIQWSAMSWKRVTSLPCTIQKLRNFAYEELDHCRLIVKLDLGVSGFLTIPCVKFLRISNWNVSVAWLTFPRSDQHDFERSKPFGNVVRISIQNALRFWKQAPQNTLKTIVMPACEQNDQKKCVSGRHIKDNPNGLQVNVSFSNIWWASTVSLLAIRHDCVARSYRFLYRLLVHGTCM